MAEIRNCKEGILDNIEEIERIMVDAALEAGAEVREVAFHKFSPQGVSGVVIISESHLAIHTWPEEEFRFAAVDVFTCGERVDPLVASKLIAERLGSIDYDFRQVERGIYDDSDKSMHSSQNIINNNNISDSNNSQKELITQRKRIINMVNFIRETKIARNVTDSFNRIANNISEKRKPHLPKSDFPIT